MQKLRIISFIFLALISASHLYAEEVTILRDVEETYLARVISVKDSEYKDVPNADVKALYQTVTISFLEGEKKGKEVTLTDTSFPITKGDKVYVRYSKIGDSSEYYSISEPYRIDALLIIVGIFFVSVLLFGGKQGFLALLALFVSFGGIFNLLFPGIINGGNVIVIATLGALLSLFVVMYLTHGFTRLTTAAFLGCVASVFVTLFFAIFSVRLAALTGFATEESVFLNLATKGGLDFVALLIGGIIIGVIGVIDDVSITQASVVNELRHANKNLSNRELYIKASKVGKDHMGAVINTLILAYAGASLPVVLLLYVSDTPMLELINREAIATEIIRASVGSVGLLFAVPLTTLIAIFLMKGDSYGDGQHHHHHAH